jgi:tRNA(Met) C34 N-acetyltransferase TmcA
MVRPVSAAAHALLERARRDLARELDAQLDAMATDGAHVDDALRAALLDDLPPPSALDAPSLRARVERYARSAQPLDVVLGSVSRFVRERPALVDRLDPHDRALLRAKVIDRASWAETAARAGTPSTTAAMRAMREAVRALLALPDRR